MTVSLFPVLTRLVSTATRSCTCKAVCQPSNSGFPPAPSRLREPFPAGVAPQRCLRPGNSTASNAGTQARWPPRQKITVPPPRPLCSSLAATTASTRRRGRQISLMTGPSCPQRVRCRVRVCPSRHVRQRRVALTGTAFRLCTLRPAKRIPPANSAHPALHFRYTTTAPLSGGEASERLASNKEQALQHPANFRRRHWGGASDDAVTRGKHS